MFIFLQNVRKSRRLELSEKEPKASQKKREYKTEHYDYNLMCELFSIFLVLSP